MSEYAFELAVSAHLEQHGPGIVSRQLGAGVEGPGRRVIDTVLVEPGPEFAARTRLPPERIPLAAIESEVGVGQARYWKHAFDCHPEQARRATDHAIDIGFFEAERRNGREYVRQVARYPDWVGGLVGIENKPDLGSPGDLETQLRKDVSLGLFDRVVLATRSHVTGAHLNRLPEEVGVWRVHDVADGTLDDVSVEVLREPTELDPGEPGVELLDEQPGSSEIAIVDGDAKQRARLRIAERAYGKGWRPRTHPACTEMDPDAVEASGLPFCSYYERVVDPAACGPDCPGFEEGETPAVDVDAIRAANSPWNPDPETVARKQAGLDSF